MPLLPFWIGSAVFFLMFLYAALVLPEALTPERQKELIRANEATQGGASYNDDASDAGSDEIKETSAKSTLARRFDFTKKLAILLPRRTSKDSRVDARLFVLAIAFAIYRIGGVYTNDVSTVTKAACTS